MLNSLLKRLIRQGRLTVLFPNGVRRTYGCGEPHISVRLHDRRATIELTLKPEMTLGELYMDGRLTVEDGHTIHEFLDLLMTNLNQGRRNSFALRLSHAFGFLLRRWRQFNPVSRAKSHVAHHYDLSGRLYDLFLGQDKQYSCGYFNDATDTLEEAQVAKKRHIAAKLFIQGGNLSILDIGCGWGGLALDLARDANARVTGVTLSDEQIAVARRRAAKAGLSKRCTFSLTDYRAIAGSFDRIVSVGMFEHVGVPHYTSFFVKISNLLKEDGVALLHFIGRVDGPGSTNPWIAKYIFPGGYAPALSEVVPVIADAGLVVTDIEVLRIHYAESLAGAIHMQSCQDFRAIRRTLLSNVGVLPCGVGGKLPSRRYGRVSNSNDQTSRDTAHHAGLYARERAQNELVRHQSHATPDSCLTPLETGTHRDRDAPLRSW
jgi:cyclopropane-fatty-acyl-phospholipid synthase